jgi:hypothetical protein
MVSLVADILATTDLVINLCLQGTSIDQDARFGDKQKKLIASMKFPPEFDKKVRTNDVNKF